MTTGAAASTDRTGTPTLRILVVDDDEFDRLAVRRCLLQAGIAVTIDEAATAMDAIARVQSGAYDCVLLDYYMPGVENVSLLRGIQAVASDMPVVMFTGRGDEEIAVEFMKAGAVDYLPKASLTPERLAASCRYAVQMARTAATQRDVARRLREREAEFRTLANAIPQMAWIADSAGRRYWYNDRWYEFTGLRPDQSLGLGWRLVHHPDHRARVCDGQAAAFARGEYWEDTFPLRRKDGVYRWFLARAVPFDEGDGGARKWFGTHTDITERLDAERGLADSEARLRAALALEQRARQDAERSEQRLALALNAGKLGAWELDLQTRVLTASAQCKANHGFAADDDLQLETHVIPAMKVDDATRFRSTLDHAIASQGSFEVELPHRWPDGSPHWLLIAGRVLDATCMVGVSLDTTEGRQLEQALLEADRRKDEFMAVVAHELRGPLAAILGAVQILQIKGPPDPLLQQQRETIIRQTNRLAKLVEDLLDVGRVIAGKLRLEKRRVDLTSILKEAVETCAPLIQQHRHTLRVVFPESAIHLDADGGRLVQVVCNLLNNAATYMQEGGRIELTGFEEAGTAVIRVRDEGVGIPPDMLDRIFHRFVQVGTSDRRTKGGLGIGLALVKAIVELNGGRVEARSDGIGTGSEFTVRLPISAAEAGDEPALAS
jgi:PAS domain S-box-containing protein